MKLPKLQQLAEAQDPHFGDYWVQHPNPKAKSGYSYFGPYNTAGAAKADAESGDTIVYADEFGKYHKA